MVIFKDRREAGKKLAKILELKKIKSALIVSLLRGGIIVGSEISTLLKVPHAPLVVSKIPSPNQSELAIGALCFDFTYLESKTINSLGVDKTIVRKQILITKDKFKSYLKKFNLNKSNYKIIKNKTVILVDDGVATGSTIKTAILFVKSLNPKKIVLAIPVAPNNFEIESVNDKIVLHYNSNFSSVSQFYKYFPQVEDDDVKRLLY